MSKTLFMETTTVPVERTVGEICACLVQAGATAISQEFADQRITSLRWCMKVNGQTVPFILPARVEPVFQHLFRKAKRPNSHDIRRQAERVAWRQILRWVQAQTALIDTGMVEAAEPFSPYIEVRANTTMFKAITEAGVSRLLLAAGEQD